MGALGFYTFKAPCVNVAAIAVGSIDIDWASVWSGNPKGTVELYISLNINNTNPYGLVFNGTDTQGYIRQGETDVGHFDIPHGVAKAKYQSIETITATLKAGGDGGVPVSDLSSNSIAFLSDRSKGAVLCMSCRITSMCLSSRLR